MLKPGDIMLIDVHPAKIKPRYLDRSPISILSVIQFKATDLLKH